MNSSPSAPDPEPESEPEPDRATTGPTEQDPDDPPQDADRSGALIIVACIAAAVLLAGAGGVVLAMPSQGSNDARSTAATDPGSAVAVAPIVDSASPSHAAGPATPALAPSPRRSVPATAEAHQSRTPEPATTSAPAPSPGFGPLVAGTYTIDRTLARTSSPALTLTLTQVTVAAGGVVTVDVTYHNTGSSALILSCGGVNDATVNLLARSDGKTYRATRSFCSDNPNAVFALSASGSGGSSCRSYAVFTGVTGQNSEFTFTWQSGQSVTGVVPGVVL